MHAAWINWVDWQSQLIQVVVNSSVKCQLNRKVVLVIFTKEQKSELRELRELRYAFEVTYIEKQTINVDA